jgi:clathrin heavy chain
MRRPIRADSAIMHLTKPIIALKAQSRTLQLFNLATKERLQTTTLSEDVLYWRWINESALGLVTDKSVYHWDVLGTSSSAPTKLFDRQANLEV